MSSGKAMIIVVISLLAIALIPNSSSRFDVFAKAKLTRGPISCAPIINDPNSDLKCCQTETDSAGLELTWCTICASDRTHCTSRYQDYAPPPVLPPKLRPPVVTTEPPSVAPPNANSLTTPGAIEQPPSTVKDNSNRTSPPSTSQRVFSPTGGCVPFTPRTPTGGCIP